MLMTLKRTCLMLMALLLSVALVSVSGGEEPRRDRAAQLINAYLENTWGEGNVVWSFAMKGKEPSFPADAEIRVVPGRRPKGSSIINLDVLRGGRLMRRIPVSVRITVFATVPVAARDLTRLKVLFPDDIRWERREVTHVNSSWIEDESRFSETAWRARMRIRAGQILTMDRMEPLPDVVSGDMVELLAVRGGVTVRADGVALQDGNAGERIRVENILNSARLKGIVKGRGVVLVEGVDGKRPRG